MQDLNSYHLEEVKRVDKFDGKESIHMGYPGEKELKQIKQRVQKQRSNTDSNQEYQYEPITEGLKELGITDFKSLFKKILLIYKREFTI